MKKLLVSLFLVIITVACGSDDDRTPQVNEKESKSSDADYSFDIVETPFGPIECIYGARYDKDGGPSCNWEKFNEAVSSR